MPSGEGISNLVEWLRAASIEREAGLLKALSQAPVPKKVPVEGTCQLLPQCATNLVLYIYITPSCL